MGYSYGTKCKKCGNEKNYLLGFGYNTPQCLDNVIAVNKNRKEKEFFEYIAKNRNAKLVQPVGYRLYECPTCKTLHSKLYIEVKYGENERYVKQYNCSKCGSILVPLPDEVDASEFRCKKCGEKALEESKSFILWD